MRIGTHLVMGSLMVAPLCVPADACDRVHTPSGRVLGIQDGADNGSFLAPHSFRWETSIEYRRWETYGALEAVLLDRAGKHVHNFAREWFYHASLDYAVTADWEVGATVTFRDLQSVFIDDARPAFVGSHDRDSSGLGDTELRSRYRFLREPLELYLFGDLSIPTGDTHNRDRLNRRFESEFQPGAGGWATTLGMGLAKQWDHWSIYWEVQHSLKFEGERDYQFGDATQARLGGSFRLPPLAKSWTMALLGDIVVQFNEPDVDRGVTLGGHRAKLLFLVPGVAIAPRPNMVVTLSAPIPVYQDWRDHQEIDYSLRLSVAISF